MLYKELMFMLFLNLLTYFKTFVKNKFKNKKKKLVIKIKINKHKVCKKIIKFLQELSKWANQPPSISLEPEASNLCLFSSV